MTAGFAPAQSALWAVIGDAAVRLAGAGVPSPRHDAEELAAHCLGLRRARLQAAPFFSAEQFATFSAMVARRELREPLQHILGTAPFRHLELAVGPGVFIPRPETEVLVDAVLAAATQGALVVDLCAGSGAIALSIAHERPDTVVHAVERDEAAFAWLARNAAAAGGTVSVHLADAADALAALDGAVDVVASNPPYLPDGLSLEPEVAAFDPAVALWGGTDGLDMVRVVSAAAARLLRPGGFLAIEHDDTHGVEAPALLAATDHWTDIADHNDFTGRPRFVTARRAG
ncbi:MAG: release factor glutamine methyltransferase [Frankiaceae bacterium]|nr:release factor glutamine methyltransferase [Frankiaceae bacterium]